MIPLKILAVGCMMGVAMYGQHGGVLRPGQPSALASPNAFPFGNILFPGGTPSNFPNALGATVGGRFPVHGGGGLGQGIGGGFGQGIGEGRGRGRTVVVPYGIPVYYGGDFGYGYNNGYNNGYQQPPPNVTVVIPQQPTPAVVINQNFVPDMAHPVMREYPEDVSSEPKSSGIKVYGGKPRAASDDGGDSPAQQAKAQATPPADDRPTIFLIALKDSSVHSAIGYWIESGTLHYVTPQGSVNRVSLGMVDRELSEQLNNERKVEFTLKN